MAYNSELRNRIIRLLAKYDSLRAKQIYALLDMSITYQAVFKMIKTMTLERMIVQEGFMYRLDPSFITEMISFVDELRLNEKDQYSSVIDAVERGETVSLDFTKQVDLLSYILGLVDALSKRYPKEACFVHTAHLFGLFALPAKVYDVLKSWVGRMPVYIVVKQKTHWNDAISLLWQRLSVQIKTGINFGGKDTFVYKHFVMRITYDNAQIEEVLDVAKRVQQMSNVNVSEMLYYLYEKQLSLQLEIVKDAKGAQQLREKMLKEF